MNVKPDESPMLTEEEIPLIIRRNIARKEKSAPENKKQIYERMRATLRQVFKKKSVNYDSFVTLFKELDFTLFICNENGEESKLHFDDLGEYLRWLRKESAGKETLESLATSTQMSKQTILDCENMKSKGNKTVRTDTIVILLAAFATQFGVRYKDDNITICIRFSK